MGQQEFARMLEGIVNDGETAGRVAEGDFSDLPSGELTEAEQALLSAAATDLDGDDVSGFANSYIKLGDLGSNGRWKIEEGEAFKNGSWTPNVRQAFSYIKIGD